MDQMNLKIKKQLLEQEKISYAMDHVSLPDGGIDCSEGCNPYGFPQECVTALRDFDISRVGPYPHSHALHDAIHDFKGLDSSAARVRMPRIDEFPVLLKAIKEINEI